MASFLRLANDLTILQNPDGGWGYFPGKESRVEPTAWIILGLTANNQNADLKVRDRGLDWLAKAQNSDGSYRSAPDASTSLWTTAPALLALLGAQRTQDWAATERSFQSLLHQKAQVVHDRKAMRSDLEAWGWTTDAFSWIEPTCLSLLALRAFPRAKLSSTHQLDERIKHGEAIVWARRCGDGGWNYGNFGGNKDYAISSFPVPTAIALVTLQKQANDPWLLEAWNRLEALRKTEASLLSLSWNVLAAKALKKPSEALENQLLSHLDARPTQANLDRGLALFSLSDSPSVLIPNP